ncbi:transcriptional regulator [Synechococcus sp. RSCCF101]|uniref:AbrB family transcriptional regulator n=1 Tax=Synechococcus sp. RSCCF101 TaxID=2511069 RepID=UPI0012452629|nr:AbrB family transcriptional regulator [Synechococcus sp. RSCCF101]QEY30942.1 transcriptional regulator [Synechococcus sp. RSCCF101]
MLVGEALLNRSRALSDRSEDDIARACGYVGPSGRVMRKSFYRALVEAKGYRIPGAAPVSAGSRGRQAEFRTRVHGNGNLLVGQAYTRLLGLEPGQECRIELERESGSIALVPVDGNEPAPPDGTPSAEETSSDV